MTHSITPDPMPHRTGRRLLPVLAAFVWAVALHVAVAAGLAGYSGATQQVDSPPRGFKMVEVPGEAGAQEATESRETSGDLREGDPSTPAPEPPPAEATAESTNDAPDHSDTPSAPQEAAEPEVIGSGGPLKERVAETDTDPSPASQTDPPPEEAQQADKDSGSDSASGGETRPEEPTHSTEPESEADTSDEDAGEGGEYRPPGVPAGYRDNPAPAYPARARQRHLEGKVVLKVAVDTEGHPTEVTVASSSGYGVLDRAAKKTVTDWTFRPAKQDGRPVAGAVKVPIHFRLSKR